MKIIRICCYAFLIWWSHLLISKTNHHLNLFFKLIFSCNHWWIINSKSWIRQPLYLYFWVPLFDNFSDRINPGVSSYSTSWTTVDNKSICRFWRHDPHNLIYVCNRVIVSSKINFLFVRIIRKNDRNGFLSIPLSTRTITINKVKAIPIVKCLILNFSS